MAEGEGARVHRGQPQQGGEQRQHVQSHIFKVSHKLTLSDLSLMIVLNYRIHWNKRSWLANPHEETDQEASFGEESHNDWLRKALLEFQVIEIAGATGSKLRENLQVMTQLIGLSQTAQLFLWCKSEQSTSKAF